MGPSQRLDEAAPEVARDLLLRCCGSTRWVERMLAQRPYGSDDVLCDAARHEWSGLEPADWLDAFSHHPAIGDREALRRRFPLSHHLSAREQDGVSGASDAALDALAEGNREYERRFGYIFVVCATGKSASEMLDMLRARLRHGPAEELQHAAAEQEKITELRLRGL